MNSLFQLLPYLELLYTKQKTEKNKNFIMYMHYEAVLLFK